jgi:hypothetical protein
MKRTATPGNSTGSSSSSRRYKYTKVLNNRKHAIRALWRRNGRFVPPPLVILRALWREGKRMGKYIAGMSSDRGIALFETPVCLKKMSLLIYVLTNLSI